MSEVQYKDIDGNDVSLDKLCRIEPEWAASRIRTMRDEIEQYQRIFPAVREFLWLAIVWNDHNFEDGTVTMKCRALCREFGIKNISDANELLSHFQSSETTKDADANPSKSINGAEIDRPSENDAYHQ